MKDQYGRTVPNDLVLLDSAWLKDDFLSEAELKRISLLNWYEVNLGSSIFVSAEDLVDCLNDGPMDFIAPEDCGIRRYDKQWMKIDDCLHRWTEEDGFYHA